MSPDPASERKASMARRQYKRANTFAQEDFFYAIYVKNGGKLSRRYLETMK